MPEGGRSDSGPKLSNDVAAVQLLRLELLRFGHSHVLLARLNKSHAINWRAELHLSEAERVNLGESHSERITACGACQRRRLLLIATADGRRQTADERRTTLQPPPAGR